MSGSRVLKWSYDCSHRVPDKDSFIKPILPGCVLDSVSKWACWKIIFFFLVCRLYTHSRFPHQRQVNAIGYSWHLLHWYSDRSPSQESAALIKTEPFAKEAASAATHQYRASKRLEEWDKVMSVPLSRRTASRWEHRGAECGSLKRGVRQGSRAFLLFVIIPPSVCRTAFGGDKKQQERVDVFRAAPSQLRSPIRNQDSVRN